MQGSDDLQRRLTCGHIVIYSKTGLISSLYTMTVIASFDYYIISKYPVSRVRSSNFEVKLLLHFDWDCSL